jgi:hypothetical protein
VTFTISGLESDDSGTLTFSDQAGHAMVVAIANGQAVDSQGHPLSTVNLSSLSDGTITSLLAISDPVGNQFSASGNTVPLDQDLGERPTVSFSGLTGGHAVEDQIITAIVTDTDNDVPTSGITYTWQISHDGGNTWSTVGGNARTYAPSEADEGGLLKVVTSFTDAAGNTESGSSSVGVLPLLTIANNSLSVNPNGSVSLGIGLTQEPTPDDTISVTISFHSSGAHDPTITASDRASGNPHTSEGITTYTFSASDVNSGLTFTNHGDQSDALTVNEILNGNIVATSQIITVTDPPVSGGGAIPSDSPVSATSEDTSVQSTSANGVLLVSNPFTETPSGEEDRFAFIFKTTLDHHTITDSEINFAHADTNHLVQQPADHLLRLPGQLDDTGALTMTDRAHPAHLDFDVNRLANFKFAEDSGADLGATSTAQSSGLSGNHVASAPDLAQTLNITGMAIAHIASEPVGSSDNFIYGKNFAHGTIADFKPILTNIDRTILADIQHLLETAHDDGVNTLDPNQASPLPHHHGDFHFA